MKRLLPALSLVALLAAPGLARAGYTETLPSSTFILDSSFVWSKVKTHWNDEGEPGPLLEEVVRYEPGGGWQGTLIPNATAEYDVLVSLLMYGVTDRISVMAGIPLVLQTSIDPDLGWEVGVHSVQIGRPYSEEDFWAWAGSMDQPKPGPWTGNKGALSDIVLGARWRFDELIPPFQDLKLRSAVQIFGALPTGVAPDPEELVAAGTMSWNLNTQGELGFHLAFERELGDRVLVGVDFFHEIFFPHRFYSSTGAVHPLLLNTRPYVGETYVIDGGDFTGVDVGVEVIAIQGPILDTWLTKKLKGAGNIPPLVTLTARYNFTYVGQTDYTSNSELWDWEQEKFWKPGYKNILLGQVMVSLLRVGVPLRLYAKVRDISLLPGKNVRGPLAVTGGLQLPLRFW
ncbi:MAG: hypothetical protein P1V51_03805 [Deltaproteobacteria bacterium]|nr:hypothetical protein [Deltaproteobacteria bacterium]